jgi:phosphocarrier protein HPr
VKIVRQVKVKNEMGLHIRPAATIVKILQPSRSMVSFTCNNETINARSIMSILTLVAKKNAKITITVEGEDAKNTMKNLIEAFDVCFGEK